MSAELSREQSARTIARLKAERDAAVEERDRLRTAARDAFERAKVMPVGVQRIRCPHCSQALDVAPSRTEQRLYGELAALRDLEPPTEPT